ncbi:protein of unknown function (plasmid) [Citrobacter freundii]|nr:protein of unknown function [Citrobacter freundii]
MRPETETRVKKLKLTGAGKEAAERVSFWIGVDAEGNGWFMKSCDRRAMQLIISVNEYVEI